MSRGLGKIQRGILDYLKNSGQHATVQELAEHLSDAPTRALRVSITRAIHSLEEKGLLQCGRAQMFSHKSDTWPDASKTCLACWLPGQEAAWTPHRVDARMVERLLIEALSKEPLTSWTAGFHMSYYVSRSVYHGLARALNTNVNWARYIGSKPVSRAIQRLEAQGIVTVRRQWHSGRVRSLKLSVPMLTVATSDSVSDTTTLTEGV